MGSNILKLLIAWILGGLIAPLWAKDLPRLRTMGVVPLQWAGDPMGPGLTKAKRQLNRSWLQVPHEAKRFRLINQEVLNELWNNAEGRHALATTYEIDGYLTLTGSVRGDLIVFTCRLMSADLQQTYLYEAETLPLIWLVNAVPETMHNRVQALLFRMLNRLPFDVTISSIHESFVTLSGGSDQNLKVGDMLHFHRVVVKDIHPALGYWLNFSKVKVARAQVIETQKTSAVAQIKALSSADALALGDGARIEHSPSRLRFQRMTAKQNKAEQVQASPIIYPQLTVIPQKQEQLPELEEVKPMPEDEASDALASVVSPSTPSGAPPRSMATLNGSDGSDEEESQTDLEQEEEMVEEEVEPLPPYKPYSQVHFHAGLQEFSFMGHGYTNVHSQMPLYIINKIGSDISRLWRTLLWEGGVEGHQSVVDGGSLNAVVAKAGVFYNPPLSLLKDAWLGVRGVYHTLGLSGSALGGYDLVKVFLVAKYTDAVPFKLFPQWRAFWEFSWKPSIIPLTAGTLGFGGQTLAVTSYWSWRASMTILNQNPDRLNYGVRFDAAHERVAAGLRGVHTTQHGISALVSMPL